MSTKDTTTLLAQLRTVLELTNTEIQVAETRVAQARTEAVQQELTENARHGRERALKVEAAIRALGGYPDVVAPFLGRATAAVKALAERAQPFDEALLGDLILEHQLLDRARYLKALAVGAGEKDVEALAAELITAHSATVEWLTTVLAEDALGGPAALRRTPVQAAAGLAVKLANLPLTWSARGIDRVLDAIRNTQPTLEELADRAAAAGDVATKAFTASRDAALETAEKVTRDAGADDAADVLHSLRTAAGVVQPEELPIPDYDELNVSSAVAAIKELTEPAEVRAVIAYEEQHRNRSSVISAAQVRVAEIAREVVGV
ncbi:hypothetical protein [Mycolicibacterium grossiae]|uniref:DUF8129 domain-containing protein n=1 Tax=Mycolicibacterium grossiae TaxID=1552759 RepID=A0A1E8PXX7_9MYCO|nr:hypothetical protein [Mycolicibacterium grossiae]OFJ50549.1 hypothetical protein BEL07_27555 [Mycolicibacterium grossiae]QEM44084.1 ferritin-like domain-containing protein [Mycolicibacterium grossiae]